MKWVKSEKKSGGEGEFGFTFANDFFDEKVQNWDGESPEDNAREANQPLGWSYCAKASQDKQPKVEQEIEKGRVKVAGEGGEEIWQWQTGKENRGAFIKPETLSGSDQAEGEGKDEQ